MQCQVSSIYIITYNLTKIHYLPPLDTGNLCLRVFAATQDGHLQVSCPEKIKQNNKRPQRRSVQCKPHQATFDYSTRFHAVFMWCSLPLVCHKRPCTMKTDKNLHPHLTVSATMFLLAFLSRNGQACLHKHS